MLINLSPALLDRLQAYQQQQNAGSIAEAVAAALQEFFKQDAYAPLARVVKLEETVDRLIAQVEQLNQTRVQSSPAVGMPRFSLAVDHAAAAAINEPYSYEDVEDEPDEILYSFLEPEANS